LYVLNFDMARFRQNKGATKKMLDAMLMANDPEKMAEMKKKLEDDKEKKNIPILSKNKGNPDLQKHVANAWLFNGIKQK